MDSLVNHIACSTLQGVAAANNVLDSLVNHIACSILQGVAAANDVQWTHWLITLLVLHYSSILHCIAGCSCCEYYVLDSLVNHIACSILQGVAAANDVLDSLVNHIACSILHCIAAANDVLDSLVNHIACSILQGVAAGNDVHYYILYWTHC